MSNDYTVLGPFVERVIRDMPQPAGSRWRLRLHPGEVLGHVDATEDGAAMAAELATSAGARARGKAKLFLECIKDGEVICTKSRTFTNEKKVTPQEGHAMSQDTAMQQSTGGAIAALAASGEPEAAIHVARYAAESAVLVARVDADARVSIAGLDALGSVVADMRRMNEGTESLTATLMANWQLAMEARVEDARQLGTLEAKLLARDSGAKDPTILQEVGPLLKPIMDAVGVRIGRAGAKPATTTELAKVDAPQAGEADAPQAGEADALVDLMAKVAAGTVPPEDAALAIAFGMATRSEDERSRMKALAESLARKL